LFHSSLGNSLDILPAKFLEWVYSPPLSPTLTTPLFLSVSVRALYFHHPHAYQAGSTCVLYATPTHTRQLVYVAILAYVSTLYQACC